MGKKKEFGSSESPSHNPESGDESFEQLMEESFKPVRSLQVGDEVEAYVVAINDEFVFLDVGTRLDGVLKRHELPARIGDKLAEGQNLKVFITGRDKGSWRCSTRIGGGDTSGEDTRNSAAMAALDDAYTRNLPVEGKVVSVVKGGFEVQVMGVKSFCPISQIDKTYCDNPDVHVNQSYTFVIIRFEEDDSNVVVSRKEFLKHEAKKEAEVLWQKVQEGDVREGVVTAIRDFGAFVDIGGIEGLLHISEISYERIKSANDVLSVGETIKVSIKNVDLARRKLSLSLKALLDDPWTVALEKLAVGMEMQGKVVRMKTFGAFVQLFPGVEGMVHISRLGTDRRHQHPKEVLSIDDIINVRIMELDKDNKKIALTMEKSESDYSADLAHHKKSQDSASKAKPGQMAGLLDDALGDQ